jgi:hypothetical protein
VRCPRCGNENPDMHRFCGMCGATLLKAPATAAAAMGQGQGPGQGARNAAESVSAATPPPALKTAPPPRAPVNDGAPVISGPSFLGLNQPAPAARRRSGLSIDPRQAPSSSSLEYLLEDDEPRHGGAGKVVLIVLALALAVGLGYLRWKHQGLSWFNLGTKNAPATTDTSNAPAPSSSSTASPSPAPAADSTGTPAGAQPVAPASTPAPAPAASSSAAPASGTPASGTPTSDAAVPATTPTSATATPASTPATSTAEDVPKAESAPLAAAPAPTAKNSDADDSDASEDTVADKPKDVPVKPAAKPAATIRPPKADSVAEAQKYLYGRGARQDCDRGMRLLKPAAAQADPKAMIEMGALYSAGLCTPRDLPTAYRWFALALRKDPDNMAVQTDLKKLWGEMTQPERQLAIRLSQ